MVGHVADTNELACQAGDFLSAGQSGRSARSDVNFVNEKSSRIKGLGGADERIRTADLRITNALLYQLSYVGIARYRWRGAGV
jgi:hypothetical protein